MSGRPDARRAHPLLAVRGFKSPHLRCLLSGMSTIKIHSSGPGLTFAPLFTVLDQAARSFERRFAIHPRIACFICLQSPI